MIKLFNTTIPHPPLFYSVYLQSEPVFMLFLFFFSIFFTISLKLMSFSGIRPFSRRSKIRVGNAVGQHHILFAHAFDWLSGDNMINSGYQSQAPRKLFNWVFDLLSHNRSPLWSVVRASHCRPKSHDSYSSVTLALFCMLERLIGHKKVPS